MSTLCDPFRNRLHMSFQLLICWIYWGHGTLVIWQLVLVGALIHY